MADKSKHKAKVRSAILDVSSKALRAEGIDGISVAAIMQRAGLTHGGFYAHFQSRDDLVAVSIDRMFEDAGKQTHRFLGADANPQDLSAFVDFYLSDAAMQSREQGCPIPSLSGEVSRMVPPAQERFEAGVSQLRDAIAFALKAIGHDDDANLASIMLAEMVGAISVARTMRNAAAASQFLAAIRADLKRRIESGRANAAAHGDDIANGRDCPNVETS